jgi:hypothetical protein
MSIFNDKTLKSVAEAALKVMEQTEPKNEKEKKLAAMAHPKDKITHKDVLVGRGVLKKEEAEQLEESRPGTTPGFHNILASDEKRREQRSTERKQQDKSTMSGIIKNRAAADAYRKSGKMKEEVEEIEEGFADMDKYMKAKAAPQPSGGAGIKQGTRYGGSKQAPDAEEHDDDDKKPARGKYGARQNYKRSMKESFSSMIEAYNEGGLKSLSQKLVSEEPDNEQFTKELEDQKASMEGKKKQPAVAAPATQGVKNMPEELELNADEINGVAIETIAEEVELDERSLTADEKADKEKYVKGMKKKLSSFKDRYGERAKEVIYATSTKMAKKD